MNDASSASDISTTNSRRPLVVGLGPVPIGEVEPVLGGGIRFEPNPDSEQLFEAEGAIVRAGAHVDAAAFDAMPKMRVLVRTGVGYDNVDVHEAARRGVPVCITPGSNTKAVAEGAFAHMLHLVKSLGSFTCLMRRDAWDESASIPIGDLDGAVLGIIGFGRIGKRVARIAAAFDLTVKAYDPVADVPPELEATLGELLSEADIVTLHLPLLESTRHIIDAAAIASMKRGAVLLNVSRGGLLDEDAALEGLESGRLSGVGLDVFETEPPGRHELYQHPRTVLSPHVLGLSTKASHNSFVMAAQIVRDVLEGRDPSAVVVPT